MFGAQKGASDIPKKDAQQFFINYNDFNSSRENWATFVRKFVAKNFQKLPNLVTLTRWDKDVSYV